MSEQDQHEPAYPQSQDECDAYCSRLVVELLQDLRDRLICVLLFGSWARGDANPDTSDIDLAVVFDTIDSGLLEKLADVWKRARVGYCNIFGIDELPGMHREGLDMFTTDARTLRGTNPFPHPTRSDLADNLVRNAEQVARMSRNLLYAYWMTPAEIQDNLEYLVGKNCLKRALRYLVAFRTARYPGTTAEITAGMRGFAEAPYVEWLCGQNRGTLLEGHRDIALRLSEYARRWLLEVAEFRQSQQQSPKDTPHLQESPPPAGVG